MAMTGIVENGATTGWLCANCGHWPLRCPCGSLDGVTHDVMCGYEHEAEPGMPW